jgi:hypothetical protein
MRNDGIRPGTLFEKQAFDDRPKSAKLATFYPSNGAGLSREFELCSVKIAEVPAPVLAAARALDSTSTTGGIFSIRKKSDGKVYAYELMRGPGNSVSGSEPVARAILVVVDPNGIEVGRMSLYSNHRRKMEPARDTFEG